MELKHSALFLGQTHIVMFWFRLLSDSININEILQLLVHSRVMCSRHIASSSLLTLILTTCWHYGPFSAMTLPHHCLSGIWKTVSNLISLLSKISLRIVYTFLVLVINVRWLALTWRQIRVMYICVFDIISYNVLFLSCHFVRISLFSKLN